MSGTTFDDSHFANTPSANTPFANAPFRDNLKKLLRERKKDGAGDEARQTGAACPGAGRTGTVTGASGKKFGKRKKAVDPEYNAECALFLSAMDGMRKMDDSKSGRRREEMRFTLEEVENFPGNGRGRGEDAEHAKNGAGKDGRTSRKSSLPGRGKGRSMAASSSSPAHGPERQGLQSASLPAATGGQKPALQGAAVKNAAEDISEDFSEGVSQDVSEDVSMASLLRGEEAPDEFLLAMEGVKPLQKAGRDVAPPAPPSSMKYVAANVLQDIIDGKVEFELTFTDEYIEGYVVGVDPLIVGKLRQGGYSPEASLDLHGLNSQQAFEALRDFIKAAWYRDKRCLVVVPGRGKNSPNGHAILREKLKLWFTQDPFKRVILAFCTARSHDGGPGAVYVLLRKFKKKGRVAWERVPADEDLL